MNKGVELLLQRMDTNPEEFCTPPSRYEEHVGKWSDLLNTVCNRVTYIRDSKLQPNDGARPLVGINPPIEYLTDEEVLAVHDKYMSVRRERFNQVIMDILINGAKQEFDAIATYASVNTSAGSSSKCKF